MSQVLEVVPCDETAGAEVGGTNIVGGLMVSGRADARRHFEVLTDPRRGQVKYPLVNVMVMTLCAVISGADDFVAVAFWAGKNRAWLEQFLDLSSGIPSHDCFNSIFARLSPAEFQQCLLNWITALHEVTGGQVIAIDCRQDHFAGRGGVYRSEDQSAEAARGDRGALRPGHRRRTG